MKIKDTLVVLLFALHLVRLTRSGSYGEVP